MLPSITVVQFSLSVGNASVVGEDVGVKVVTVSLTGDLKRDVAVKIATIAGTGLLRPKTTEINIQLISLCIHSSRISGLYTSVYIPDLL